MIAYGQLIAELEGVIAMGASDRRVDALRRVTDLFVLDAPNYSGEQVELFGDVISRLADRIETQARAELANRLGPIANAPIRIVKTLAQDDVIAVAAPVLTHSPLLDEHDLVETARTRSQQHLLAISKRGMLSEAVTDVLVVRGDQTVVRTVANNEGARFSHHGFDELVRKSAHDDILAEHVGLRPDIPPRQFLALLGKASATVQSKLAANGRAMTPELKGILARIQNGMQAEAGVAQRDYTQARAVVEHLRREGTLGDEEVRALAKAKRFEETIAALAALSSLPIETVEHALTDSDADMALILARAAGLSWPTLKAIILLVSPGGSASEQDLANAQESFMKLQIVTAQRVLRFHRVRQSAAM